MLGEIMRLKQGSRSPGTHGKTTTDLADGAGPDEAGFDPTIVVGGRVHILGTNARLGKGEYLVAEADEYDRSFLELTPVVAVDHQRRGGPSRHLSRHRGHLGRLRRFRQPRSVLRRRRPLRRRPGSTAHPAHQAAHVTLRRVAEATLSAREIRLDAT
jgi:hypothetical protein